MDYNLVQVSGLAVPRPAKGFQKISRQDEHSIEADAMYVDPAHGDYRVQQGSSALALEFKNFPMDQFGVTSAKLKAKARTPVMPRTVVPAEKQADHPRGIWLGATVRTIEGMEFSLFGSNAVSDPGWDTANAKLFTPLGKIRSERVKVERFLAASLRARPGKTLGTFRWIVWKVSPVTSLRENTAFQELAVETLNQPANAHARAGQESISNTRLFQGKE